MASSVWTRVHGFSFGLYVGVRRGKMLRLQGMVVHSGARCPAYRGWWCIAGQDAPPTGWGGAWRGKMTHLRGLVLCVLIFVNRCEPQDGLPVFICPSMQKSGFHGHSNLYGFRVKRVNAFNLCNYPRSLLPTQPLPVQ